MTKLKKHLTPATALSCVALFIALGGGAYAASTLTKKSVKTQHLGNGSVTTQKLRNGAVTTAKLRNLSVSNPKLADAAVSSTKIANGAVRSAALGGQVVTTGKLKNGGVTEEKLANNAVGTDKLTANAVATGKLQDGVVSAAKLNSGLLAQLVKNVSYETKESATDAEDSKTVTAECPQGKQVTGGGLRFIPDTFEGSVYSVDSFPAINVDQKRTGWTVSAREIATADAGTWTLEAYAICAEF